MQHRSPRPKNTTPSDYWNKTWRLKRTFAASVAHRNSGRFILARTLSSNYRSWWPVFPRFPRFPRFPPLSASQHIVVAFYCFIFGYPLTTLFSFAFIAGFVFRLIVRRCFGAVLISVLPVVGQLCMNISKFNTNITFVRLLPSPGILLPSGGGYNSILGR